MSVVQPSTPAGVVDAIVSLISSRPGRLRVAIDGAPAADPVLLAEQVVLELTPRCAVLVRAHHFWRQASLRLEDGRHDADAWLDHWLAGVVPALGDRRPLDVLNEPGGLEVLRSLLLQAQYGAFS